MPAPIRAFVMLVIAIGCHGAFALSNLPVSNVELSASKEWLNLLYYEKNKHGYRSVVTNPAFFVDREKGSTDPVRELEQTVRAFKQDLPSSNNHPQCLFPARYLLLKKHFDLRPPVVCPQYDEWLDQYRPQSLYLVYASQYISNPASVLGHTFLLATSARQTKGFWLTYNFAATIPKDTSGMGYVYGGLTGWFTGDFSVMPFYNRIYQYGSIENRDLWLYQIKLSPEEQSFFLRHLWELVHVGKFTYYFMDENCAGVLLRTLAAVLPDLRNVNKLDVSVAPIEVVRTLDQAGRIESTDLIPSQTNTLRANLRRLDRHQRNAFDIASQNPELELEPVDKDVSESLVNYTMYVTHKNGGTIPPEFKKLERSAYIQRARFSESATIVTATESESASPKLAHAPSAVQLGVSRLRLSDTVDVLDLGYRFTIHDFMDPDSGFLKNSSVEFLNVQLSANSSAVWIRDLTLVRVDNFQPLWTFDPQASWQAKVSIVENILTENLTDQFVQTKLGLGATFEFADQYVYTMISSEINVGSEIPQAPVRLGPSLGTILKWGQTKIFIEGNVGQALFGGQYDIELKFNSAVSVPINSKLSFILKTDWIEIPGRNLSHSRTGTALRFFF